MLLPCAQTQTGQAQLLKKKVDRVPYQTAFDRLCVHRRADHRVRWRVVFSGASAWRSADPCAGAVTITVAFPIADADTDTRAGAGAPGQRDLAHNARAARATHRDRDQSGSRGVGALG